jgi:hypothetical protein
LVTSRGQRYWFHAIRNENTDSAAIIGRARGTATPQQEAPVAVAVEGGGVAQVLGHLQEGLAQQERAERGGEERAP